MVDHSGQFDDGRVDFIHKDTSVGLDCQRESITPCKSLHFIEIFFGDLFPIYGCAVS